MKLGWGMALAAAGMITALSFSCASTKAVVEKPFVMTELEPAKEEPVAAPTVKMKTVQGRILEITEDRGVQKFVFLRFVGVKAAVKQYGDIYADSSCAQKIGRFQVIEVFTDAVKAQVLDLTFKIGKTAVATFETPDA